MCLETEVASREPAQVCLHQLFYIHVVAVSLVVGRLVVGDLVVGEGVPLTLLFVPGTLFLLLGYLVQLQCEGFCLLLLYLFSLFGCCLLKACSFLMGDRGRVDLEERGTGRSRGRKVSSCLPYFIIFTGVAPRRTDGLIPKKLLEAYYPFYVVHQLEVNLTLTHWPHAECLEFVCGG